MDYISKITENRDLQIQVLQELVSLNSVQDNPAQAGDGEVYPFGKGVQDAFAYTLKKAEELGFETKNVDNYGGHIDFGTGEETGETVGILGHLDVVPEGGGWSFDPFSGAVSDGYIYGRGTQDDKGPVVAVLFAMKALKDAGYEPARKVRLILGLDEETGWKGMDYYFQKEPRPDFGFTPDSDFPALNGEKGIVTYEIAKKFTKTPAGGLELRSLKGGSAANMVAEKARAVVRSQEPEAYDRIRQQAAEYRAETGYRLQVKGTGKSLEITAEGKSAHGAVPEAGLNAISIIMDFLGRLNFANDDVNVFIDFYNRHIGFEYNGQSIGCGFEDEPSGKLTLNSGLIQADGEAVSLTINIRYPVTFTDQQIYDGILPYINEYDMGIIRGRNQNPIYMDENSPMIRALVDVYAKNTGDTESRPLVIGGGTYARATGNIVAFGALFPGDEDLMHQKNERLSIDRFMLMTKIYADAIYKLTQKEFTITEEQ
ncbi:MAG: dipeptidase PepV [Emergencia sp.]